MKWNLWDLIPMQCCSVFPCQFCPTKTSEYWIAEVWERLALVQEKARNWTESWRNFPSFTTYRGPTLSTGCRDKSMPAGTLVILRMVAICSPSLLRPWCVWKHRKQTCWFPSLGTEHELYFCQSPLGTMLLQICAHQVLGNPIQMHKMQNAWYNTDAEWLWSPSHSSLLFAVQRPCPMKCSQMRTVATEIFWCLSQIPGDRVVLSAWT